MLRKLVKAFESQSCPGEIRFVRQGHRLFDNAISLRGYSGRGRLYIGFKLVPRYSLERQDTAMRSDIVPGNAFPDYALPDHTSTVRKLTELQGRDPMVLLLSRGHF